MALALDYSGLQRRVQKMQAAAADAAGLSVKALMDPVMRSIVGKIPVDTHRLQRGYAMAANQAGLGPFSVPAVNPSKYRGKIGDELAYQMIRFEKQVEFWTRLIQKRYIDTGRSDKWKRDAERKLRVAQKRLRSAQIQAAKFGFTPEAIAIYRSSKNGLKVTVRDKVYGGSGKSISRPGFHGVEIWNHEPHASIVESYRHTVRDAFAEAKGSGVIRFKNAYLKQINYV